MTSIEDFRKTFRRMHETKIETGEIRETPGAVVSETEHITGLLLKALEGSPTSKQKAEKIKALIAASAVEEEMIEKIRKSGKTLDELLNGLG